MFTYSLTKIQDYFELVIPALSRNPEDDWIPASAGVLSSGGRQNKVCRNDESIKIQTKSVEKFKPNLYKLLPNVKNQQKNSVLRTPIIYKLKESPEIKEGLRLPYSVARRR